MTDRPAPAEPSVTITEDERGTEALGEQLAATLRAGDVVLLSGPLGAGKTAFVRGLARGLGLGAADVSSPTFTLIHEYRGGRLTLFHVDLYRLTSADAQDLGLQELGVDDGVLAIEWSERLTHPVRGSMTVRLEPMDDAPETWRRVTVTQRAGHP
jgi:tRNA threonylcarbamoyladenosine biosynthesis protein TsaE